MFSRYRLLYLVILFLHLRVENGEHWKPVHLQDYTNQKYKHMFQKNNLSSHASVTNAPKDLKKRI